MKFNYHQDSVTFNNLRKKLVRNGLFWNRKKDHIPLMRLYKTVDDVHITILLDKIYPWNSLTAHGMIFMKGSIGTPVKINIEEFLTKLDYKWDQSHSNDYAMSEYLAKSFKSLHCHIDFDGYKQHVRDQCKDAGLEFDEAKFDAEFDGRY